MSDGQVSPLNPLRQHELCEASGRPSLPSIGHDRTEDSMNRAKEKSHGLQDLHELHARVLTEEHWKFAAS